VALSPTRTTVAGGNGPSTIGENARRKPRSPRKTLDGTTATGGAVAGCIV
jgi:hypothetical protein